LGEKADNGHDFILKLEEDGQAQKREKEGLVRRGKGGKLALKKSGTKT